MEKTPFDLLVVGGGITGSGIALDAATRGFKVGLIEKNDFASGTSSRSGKLIHGGLKYLKQGDLALVKEVGRERAIVHENARHLVIPIQMLFPIVKNGSFNKFTLKIGLSVYDRLAGVKKEERHFMLSKKEVFAQEPLINRDTVKGGGMYIEYRTDDSRLTLEVAKTAFEHGALISNYAEMVEFLQDENGQAIGVVVLDHASQRTFKLYAKFIVNAGGPWVDKIRRMEGELQGKRLHLTKGIHIVVPFERFPVKESIYYDVKGRMIAVVPRDGCTYIGSTENDYLGSLDDIRVSQSEVDYLLDCVNLMFPSVELKQADIISTWAGLRPLIHEEGKAAGHLSRKDEIFISESGLITIAGGKLTGYRKMAERVVNLVQRKGGFPAVPSKTETVKLTGGRFDNGEQLKQCIGSIARDRRYPGMDAETASDLVFKYGSNAGKVLDYLEDMDTKSLIAAEVRFCIEQEMAMKLSDFFLRRTGRLLFKRKDIPALLEAAASEFARVLGWDGEQAQKEKVQFNEEYAHALQFI
ncbi:glycerol-3-phosphate dehydrogenase/oxidase [Paenibacillus darwinianus]|nr:glycerol-3-phosphate dehydrogenase/oxidase [Paenibacillus darwinianus]